MPRVDEAVLQGLADVLGRQAGHGGHHVAREGSHTQRPRVLATPPVVLGPARQSWHSELETWRAAPALGPSSHPGHCGRTRMGLRPQDQTACHRPSSPTAPVTHHASYRPVCTRPYPQLSRWVRQLSLQFANKEARCCSRQHDLPTVTRKIPGDPGPKPSFQVCETSAPTTAPPRSPVSPLARPGPSPFLATGFHSSAGFQEF